jgi:DNA repair protein RecN (Recombination protein N)
MLNHIHIQNYALIDSLDIHLDKGFIALTGETGAGKSILLDALGLALGKRADVSSISDKDKKCIVEVTFDIKKLGLENLLHEYEIDINNELILRREIYADGRSRAFANDTPVNLSVLKVLSEMLIDIHSQHEAFLLSDVAFQFNLIDAFSQTTDLKREYHEAFQAYIKQNKLVEQLKEEAIQIKKDYDYNLFQFNELNALPLKDGYQQNLENQFKILANAENIKSALQMTDHLLVSSDENVLQILNQLKTSVASIAKYDKAYEELLTRINGVIIEIKDIASESDNLNNNIEFNAEALDKASEELNSIQKLLKKHNVSHDKDLIAIKAALEVKLDGVNNIDSEISKAEKTLKTLFQSALSLANTLSESRNKAKVKLEKVVGTYLQDLAMPNAQFVIDLKEQSNLNQYGNQSIAFLFSANKGMEARELSKVASGGEMSRLMLTLKTIMAKGKQIPTIIFDEIDTGVSGSIASKMADLMLAISGTSQVFAITHLPQIASKAQSHLFVYKKDNKQKTTSFIKTLNTEERVEELANMLSDGRGSEASLKNAKALLGIT